MFCDIILARMPNLNEGAVRLKRAMTRRREEQADVRRRLGAPSGVVSRWLSGECRPSLVNALALQRLYGVPVACWHKPFRSDPGSVTAGG